MTHPTPDPVTPAAAEVVEPDAVDLTPDMLAPPEVVDPRVDFERGMSVFPWLSIALIAANVAVFGWELSKGALANEAAIIDAGALHRASVLAGEVWRLPWSMFLHGGFDHLIGNCIILYILGMGLEHAIGILPTAALYLVSGLCGALLSTTMHPGPSVGASGAIFGVAGALVIFLYRFRHFFFVRDKQIGYILLGWAVYSVVIGFLSPHIDNYAHIGGFTGGAVAALLVKPRLQPPAPGFAMKPNAPRI